MPFELTLYRNNAPKSILVYNTFYISTLVFSVLSQNISESATFVTLMEHS